MSPDLARIGRILRLGHDPGLRVEALQAELESCPGLAPEVARLAGSRLYGLPGRIRRLDRTILILGPGAVAEIAASALVARGLMQLQIGVLAGTALLQHSLEIAIGAQFGACRLGVDLEREAYLAGLLHDLGICAMLTAHGQEYAAVVTRAICQQRSLSDLERRSFGTTHAEALAEAVSAWELPRPLRFGLAPGRDRCPETQPERTLAELIQSAHAILSPPEPRRACLGGGCEIPNRPTAGVPLQTEAWERRVRTRVEDLCAHFRVPEAAASVGGAGLEPATRAL